MSRKLSFTLFASIVLAASGTSSARASSYRKSVGADPTVKAYGEGVLPLERLRGEKLRDLLQVTGKNATGVDWPEIADPMFRVQPDGHVLVTGSTQNVGGSNFALRFKNLETLLKGGPYRVVRFDMRMPDGRRMPKPHEYKQGWDTTVEPWGFAYNGALPELSPQQRWDELNVDRDVFAYVPQQVASLIPQARLAEMSQAELDGLLAGKVKPFPRPDETTWVRMKEPIFSDPAHPRVKGSFLNHRYGHRFIKVRGRLYVFYEEVVAVNDRGEPSETWVLAREMKNTLKAKDHALRIMGPYNGFTGESYPAARRADGGLLVEGPSPYLDGDSLGVLFSAGDFFGKYGVNHLSMKVEDFVKAIESGAPTIKPEVSLSDDGRDLFDSVAELTRKYDVRLGLARPTPVHAADGSIVRRADGAFLVSVHGSRDHADPSKRWPLWHPHRSAFLVWLKPETDSRGARRLVPQDFELSGSRP